MDTRFVDCDPCHGTGRYWRHDPQFDDPYLETETHEECRHCGGKGALEIEAETTR